MSRTPVRAALQQLELEGYLRIVSKHGVILLDSSSQRVSDLLEIIVSMVLYAVTFSWNSQRQELIDYADNMISALSRLIDTKQADDCTTLTDFEFELFSRLISLCNNDEMTKTFQTATSRLFWNRNDKRWKSPYSVETSEVLLHLIQSLSKDIEAFREALFHYQHTLKRTWL